MSAIHGIETRFRQIGLTKQIRDLLRDNVKDLEKQLDVGAATTLDLRQASLNVLSAETDLLRDVIEWKLAIIKLKEMQGLLAEECGYSICTCD
jgi:outer membrane protein TolC